MRRESLIVTIETANRIATPEPRACGAEVERRSLVVRGRRICMMTELIGDAAAAGLEMQCCVVSRQCFIVMARCAPFLADLADKREATP